MTLILGLKRQLNGINATRTGGRQLSMVKILGTGLTGLVGSRIVELLSDKYEFENLSLDEGVDITKKEEVIRRVADSPARVILHLAAKTDVDGCEKDKLLGENGDAWRINVEGTKNIVEGAKLANKQIIYISTDFVFDGTREFYNEEDNPNPINWYGVTKYEGEKVVKDSGIPYLICRLAYPFRAKFGKKRDFVRGILERLKEGRELAVVKDQVITPTFIDDIAYALNILIKNDARGIYHVVGGSYHTPLEVAYLIAKIFNFDKSLISETSREVFFAGRAPRPFSLALKNDKLKKLGIKMSTFEKGLEKIKNQLITHNS